jgi:hypothetical protein
MNRNNALFLIKAAVIKKTCPIFYHALDQANRWSTAPFVCFNTSFQKRLDLARRYLGKSNLWLMLVLGIILTVLALILLDYEVKCELEKKKQV